MQGHYYCQERWRLISRIWSGEQGDFCLPKTKQRSRPRRVQFLSTVSRMSRAPKRARKTPDNDGTDRLSDLPDGILCHILTFLDTKYAVATCVLSTRWKDLFLSLPNIVLDDSLTRKRRNKKVLLEFAKFGLKQIMLRDVPHINKFGLRCNFNFKDPAIQTLVCAAIWRNVKEVDICVGKRVVTGILPPEVFSSRTLVVLKLRGRVKLDVPEFVSLPKLKVMLLGDFILASDDSMRRLFRGCKLLEDLSMSKCNFWLVDVLDLSTPLLRKLSFNYPCSIVETKLVIDTPNLEFFEYRGHTAKFNLVKKLKSLARAEIYFVTAPKLKNSFVEDHRENVSEFINKLCGVKSIYLSIDSLEAMYPGCFSLYVFETLTALELVGAFNLQILPSILESAPQLQVLIIPISWLSYHDARGEALYSLPETVPVCLAKHLRNIKFKYFRALESVFQLVKYFLQNGKVLERMMFTGLGPWDSDLSLSAHKKISMFPRCSKTCEIVFEQY
ncbi:F-box/LRR-repeat protein [Abeliophyllum distichum]|uniref:F-box/LRR-repeat protein n=1 Tax=Abeliophyllum distichum TaxID=126358 RepID=A0ABD1T0X7_9LAMI